MNTLKSYHYFLVPGLGFNSKTFRNLNLHSAASINFIDWLEPEAEETLSDYIIRMSKGIDNSLPNKIFIGHSFGGVMVQELAQIMDKVEKVFLVSSIKTPSEMSWNVKVLRKIPLYKFVNHDLINSTFPLWAKLHDFHNKEERDAFTDMVNDMTMSYFKWAVNAIVKWKGIKNRKIDPIHIHGDNDQTFFYNKIKRPVTIKDGGHFIVYNRAEEVSKIIQKELDASNVPIFSS
jgi:pimeloyl-ACP methyl ester carboxylesterase